MEDDQEISLEDLSKTYQQFFAAQQPAAPESDEEADQDASIAPAWDDEDQRDTQSDLIATTPEAIIEAILFVGNAKSKPTSSVQMAELMRGVTADDITTLVASLNERYEANRNAMRIIEPNPGQFQLTLDPMLADIRSVFAGRLQTVKLNQPAIDCLALAAYNPGSTMAELEALANRPVGSVIRMLLRRNLLRLERSEKAKAADGRYFPTERFLDLVGIVTLQDLPTI